MTTELCAYSVEACAVAARTGVTRVELCASPWEGGTTPSAATIRLARCVAGIRLCVMIRPRGGDFCYSDGEFRQMADEIRFARECEADGVVLGLLCPDGRIEIMAGSGVNASNARLLALTGVDALHFSARGWRDSRMEFRNPRVLMGGVEGVPEYAVPCADESLIRQILAELDR